MPRRFFNLARRARQLTSPGGRPAVGQTPAHVIHTENKWRLLHYRPVPDHPERAPDQTGMDTPILLVPSLINRHYVLDLMPGKSLVEYLVARGHEVYIIDWGTPGQEDRFLTFDDICDGYLGRAVRAVARRSPVGQVHLLGYCLGGTLTTIYAAVHPEQIASMVALAAPIDFSDDGQLAIWSRTETLDLEAIVEACGNVPWQLMQLGFNLLRPTMSLSKAVYMLDRAWDDEFLDGFFALETWGNDNVSFPGQCFLRYIDELYRNNALVRGRFTLSGHPVRLEHLTCPVLAVTFEHDNIVPWQSAAALLDLVGSKVAERMHLHGGHVGAVVSKKASKTLWPQLSDWFTRDAPATLT